MSGSNKTCYKKLILYNYDMELPPQFFAALQIPKGEYYTPKIAKVRPDETMLVRAFGTAITNATSNVPIIGTAAFNPCGCVILYNTKTKTAALIHESLPDEGELQKLLSMVKKNDSDNIEVHIVGLSKYAPRDLDDVDLLNEMRVEALTNIIDAIKSLPNVSLKTFDVYNKPKPHAVAIDTRDGKLIRGSKLFITVGEGNEFGDSYRNKEVVNKHCALSNTFATH